MSEIFVYEQDLLFSSKFESISRQTGINFKLFSVFEELTRASREKKPGALILNLDTIKPEELSTLTGGGYPVMGYYSHVNAATGKLATEMGVKYVATRGVFLSNIETLLRRLLAGN